MIDTEKYFNGTQDVLLKKNRYDLDLILATLSKAKSMIPLMSLFESNNFCLKYFSIFIIVLEKS